MNIRPIFLSSPLLAAVSFTPLHARTWTSVEGVQIEANYISSSATTVTVQRISDLRRFTFEISKLSEQDQTWLKEQSSKPHAKGDASSTQTPTNIPAKIQAIINERGKLLLEDDFNREDPDGEEQLGKNWVSNSKSRAQGDKQCDLVNGTLQLTLSPKADHAISLVHNTSEPYQEAISWTRVKFPTGQSFKIAFNDKQYKPVHAGHINGVTVRNGSVNIDDEKNGRFSAKAKAMRNDDSKEKERAELIAQFSKQFPVRVKGNKWFDLVTHHEGETLTVYIDGKEVGSYTSNGFAHETKRQLAFAPSKDATVDHTMLWKIEPK